MFSVYVGVISYFIIAPIFGETGIINYKKLNNNLIMMKKHIENLKMIQKNLKTKYINLQISKPAILREASKLSYYPQNSIINEKKKIKHKTNIKQYKHRQKFLLNINSTFTDILFFTQLF
ncbi:septum formation initiator family protein [Borrelia duttonii]|nr:septum formation initiator family protein [Borrelia duttonii]